MCNRANLDESKCKLPDRWRIFLRGNPLCTTCDPHKKDFLLSKGRRAVARTGITFEKILTPEEEQFRRPHPLARLSVDEMHEVTARKNATGEPVIVKYRPGEQAYVIPGFTVPEYKKLMGADAK